VCSIALTQTTALRIGGSSRPQIPSSLAYDRSTDRRLLSACGLDAISPPIVRLGKARALKQGQSTGAPDCRMRPTAHEGAHHDNVSARPERKAQEFEWFRPVSVPTSLEVNDTSSLGDRNCTAMLMCRASTQNLRARGYTTPITSLPQLRIDASPGGGLTCTMQTATVYGCLPTAGVHPASGSRPRQSGLVTVTIPAQRLALPESDSLVHTKLPVWCSRQRHRVGSPREPSARSRPSRRAIRSDDRQPMPVFHPSSSRPSQRVLAGTDVEALRLRDGTPRRYWLSWREPSDIVDPLDRALSQLCSKDRLLELSRLMVFDAGVKKTFRLTSTSL